MPDDINQAESPAEPDGLLADATPGEEDEK